MATHEIFNIKGIEKLKRRERKLLETRIVIVASAVELLEKTNLDNLRMEDLADLADLSRPTLYNHFKSKEEILLEIGMFYLNWLQEEQERSFVASDSFFDKVMKLSSFLITKSFEFPLAQESIRFYLTLNKFSRFHAHDLITLFADKGIDIPKTLDGNLINLIKKVEPLIDHSNNTEDNIFTSESFARARFLALLRRTMQSWVTVIEEGIREKTINDILDPNQYARFIFIVISGVHDRSNLESIALERAGLTQEKVIKLTLDVIRKIITY